MIFLTIMQLGMGLINFKLPLKRVSKRSALRLKFKANLTEKLLSLYKTKATLLQNS